jgi:hypothetical protein
MGPEFTYMVWYAKQPKGPWIRHNEIRLTDEIVDYLRGFDIDTGEYYETFSYNEYYIDGLDEQTNYSVKVTCHDRYDAWWYSQTDYDSVGGGMRSAYSMPSPDGGNRLGFQFYVDLPVLGAFFVLVGSNAPSVGPTSWRYDADTDMWIQTAIPQIDIPK